jgi:hypothetical protein
VLASYFRYLIVASLAGVTLAPTLQGEERSLTIVFGPGSVEAAKQGARAASTTARRWLQTKGSTADARQAGSTDALTLDPQTPGKVLDQALLRLAMQARDGSPKSFLVTLDAAVQAAALRGGTRVVVGILSGTPWSSDAEQTLNQLGELCRKNGVRVSILDMADVVPGEPGGPLKNLAIRTGGAWMDDPKTLDNAILSVAPAPVEQAAEEPAPEPAPAEPAGNGMEFRIPVHTRFIRTSSVGTPTTGAGGTMNGGKQDQKGVMMSEGASMANDATGPMRGLVMVESPISALKFDVDDTTGTFLARARIVSKVLNEKGRTVWSGQKEVTLRGPLRKLETRRQGGLYYMREITVTGGQRYTIEATVEDLIAGTSGHMRIPLRSGRGAPGLMASDALFVKPLHASVDRIEADSVFSYDGEALCPNLNPVVPAGQPVNLQLYFVLYPDTYGTQPEINVELRREGQVVGRIPVQFTSQLFDQSKDGKFGTAAGKGSAMMGSRAQQFPYLANVKGAKLPAGEYEAVVTIRQARSVITRNVSFRVLGEPSPAPLLASTKPGLLTRNELEETDFALPEIQPATIDSSGLAMSPEEQKRLWEEAAANALGYSSRLPNFRCIQETHRFTAPAKTPDQLKQADSYKNELTYEDGKETYRTLEINGEKAERSNEDLKGVHSRGEFGTMLRGLFEPEAATRYKWAGRAMAMGVLCQVFDVEVDQPKSNFTLTFNGRREKVGFTGRVFVDEETGLVRRLTIQGSGMSKDFALQSPSFSLEYAMVRIGNDDYLLPMRSVLQLRQMKIFVRNETEFTGYRKFEASSDIKVVGDKLQ